MTSKKTPWYTTSCKREQKLRKYLLKKAHTTKKVMRNGSAQQIRSQKIYMGNDVIYQRRPNVAGFSNRNFQKDCTTEISTPTPTPINTAERAAR